VRGTGHRARVVPAHDLVFSWDQPAFGLHLHSFLRVRWPWLGWSTNDFWTFGSWTWDSRCYRQSVDHLFLLSRLAVKAYMKLRKYHMLKSWLKSWNIKQQGKMVRQTLTKAVLF